MILLVGPGHDPPLRAVAAELERRGAQYLCLDRNVELLAGWQYGLEAVLEVSGQRLSLKDVTAAYLRPFGAEFSTDNGRGTVATFLAWADQSSGRIINRPAASLLNNSKPLQTQSIARFGLQVPETLITTDPEAIRDFVSRHGEVVYKSTSGVRSIVRRLSSERLSELQLVTCCPTQFQRYIPGDELRVHVIGDYVSAVQITCNRDDYRYAARDGGFIEAKAIQLESATADALRKIVKGMGLLVAGVDLRRTCSGELFCLEINPSPAFTYYEQLAGVALAPQIAELLSAT